MAMAPLAVPINEPGMDEVERAQVIARRYHAEFVDLKNFKISHELFKSVPVDMMFRYNFVPLEQMEGTAGDCGERPVEADGAGRDLGAAGAAAGDAGGDAERRLPNC